MRGFVAPQPFVILAAGGGLGRRFSVPPFGKSVIRWGRIASRRRGSDDPARPGSVRFTWFGVLLTTRTLIQVFARIRVVHRCSLESDFTGRFGIDHAGFGCRIRFCGCCRARIVISDGTRDSQGNLAGIREEVKTMHAVVVPPESA